MDASKYIKGSSTSFQAEKMHVKNTKGHNVTRNERIWAMGSTIEVDQKEAEDLHKEGFLVMDSDDLAEAQAIEAEEKQNVSRETLGGN